MTISYGQPAMADFGVLRGGDSNGDNAVTLVDFSIPAQRLRSLYR
jgi:hypothetical protein